MGAIKIDQQIVNYLPQLSAKQKDIVLGVVRRFADEQQDWFTELPSSRQAAIDEAIGQVRAGKGTRHEQVIKKYQKWRGK